MVRKIPHSNSALFHHATAVKAAKIGRLIFNNLGHVISPSGGFSRYGVPGMIFTQQQFVSIAWTTISTLAPAGNAPASNAARAGLISIDSTHAP